MTFSCPSIEAIEHILKTDYCIDQFLLIFLEYMIEAMRRFLHAPVSGPN